MAKEENSSVGINLGSELEFRMSVMKLMYFIIVVFQTTMQRSHGSSAHLVPRGELHANQACAEAEESLR